jgi:hypothetical protein
MLFSVFVLSANTVFSQSGTTAVAMGQEFAELAAHGGLAGKGFAAFQTYSSNQVDGSQFFFPDWAPGEIVTTHKEVFNEGLQFIYDKVRQQLFFRKKDSSLILLGNKDEIQSFSLKDGDKQYYFVNSKLFTDERPEVFYQVLIYDSSKLSLLKYIKTTLVKADLTDMMKQRQGEVYDAFVDKIFYYIVMDNGIPLQVQLKSKSLKKTFAELNINPEKYMSDHPEPINEDYLINMVRQFNQ